MCTLAIYFNVFEALPIVVAANRDEHFDRPSAPPAPLPGQPTIVAGRDLRVGGTWLGVNQHGLLVGILNRRQNDANQNHNGASELRSRGLLCMDLLHQRSAAAGMELIANHRETYNPFTTLFADRDAAYVAYNNHSREIITKRLDPGLHVFSSAAELDLNSAKADLAHPRFAQLKDGQIGRRPAAAELIDPLKAVLSDHSLRQGSNDPGDAICVHRESTGTVSASIVALSSPHARFETYFCPGPPCRNDFTAPVALSIR